jgi:hypothetical protein
MIRLPHLSPVVFAVALVLGWASPLFADDAVVGRIKSVTGGNNQFTLTQDDGKDRLYTLAENGTVHAGKVADLKAGDAVIVTYVTIGDALWATAVLPAPKDEGRGMAGTIKSVPGGAIAKNQFVLTDKGGKDWLFTLTDNARVATATDPSASLRDLKVGDRVQVTYVRMKGGVYASEVRPPARSGDAREPKPGETGQPKP